MSLPVWSLQSHYAQHNWPLADGAQVEHVEETAAIEELSCVLVGAKVHFSKVASTDQLTVGAFHNLVAHYQRIGEEFLLLQRFCALELRRPTLQSFVAFVVSSVAHFDRFVLRAAEEEDVSMLSLLLAVRMEAQKLSLLCRLCSVFATADTLEAEVALQDAVDELRRETCSGLEKTEEGGDMEDFVRRLHAAVFGPLCRSISKVLLHGDGDTSWAQLHSRAFPSAMFEKLLRMKDAVSLMKRLQRHHTVERDHVFAFSELEERTEYFYKFHCRRAVDVVLFELGGLELTRKMRQFYCLESMSTCRAFKKYGVFRGLVKGGSIAREFVFDESSGAIQVECEWPLNEVLTTPLVVDLYNRVLRFLLTLQTRRAALAALGEDIDWSFRQKALHCVVSVANYVALRLTAEPFSDFAESATACPDVAALCSAHQRYVQRLADVCFQNEATAPLRRALEGMIEATSHAVLDRNRTTLKNILAGIVQQNRSIYLDNLLHSL